VDIIGNWTANDDLRMRNDAEHAQIVGCCSVTNDSHAYKVSYRA